MQTETIICKILIFKLSNQNEKIFLQPSYRSAQGVAYASIVVSAHDLAKSLQSRSMGGGFQICSARSRRLGSTPEAIA